jgi:hypothetical protein
MATESARVWNRGGAFQAPCPRPLIGFSHHLEIIDWADAELWCPMALGDQSLTSMLASIRVTGW